MGAVSRLTNDAVRLVPRTGGVGPALRFDFPGLRVGVAEYDEGPTGCTVFHFPAGAACSVDVRGGSPGMLGPYEFVHAICLAGGSLYGLEAATGVAAELFAQRGYATGWTDIPVVAGAIVFDWGPRETAIYPDKELGRAALRAARAGVFPVGRRGAGRSATVGKGIGFDQFEYAGQGAAFREFGPTKVAVFTVVNAVGAILDREGRVVRGNRDPRTGERHDYLIALERRLAEGKRPEPARENTTLTVVVTNQTLAERELRQLARLVHASMTRAIRPFHAFHDGDILYAVSTGGVEEGELDVTALGVLTSELAWDAVLAAGGDADAR
jgi:L-aminopeptidase/D-esterase-like protein